MRRVTIVDYGRGNLFSLARALEQFDATYEFTESPETVAAAESLILPGVGAFGDAMQGLRDRNLTGPIQDAARSGTPLLGICLGMQVLASEGEEFGTHEGLNLIPGTVKRLPQGDNSPDTIRIPNVGWRALDQVRSDPLLGQNDEMYYFVHSYTPIVSEGGHIVATIPVNGRNAAAIIRRQNILGVQFHPEKSGPAGLRLLRRFVETEEFSGSASWFGLPT